MLLELLTYANFGQAVFYASDSVENTVRVFCIPFLSGLKGLDTSQLPLSVLRKLKTYTANSFHSQFLDRGKLLLEVSEVNISGT